MSVWYVTFSTVLFYQEDHLQQTQNSQNDQLVKESLESVAEQWGSFLRLKDKELKDADREFHGLWLVKEATKAELYREVLMKGKASHLAQVASEQVERLQEELKETKNETQSLQLRLRMMEKSLHKGQTRLNQLKERKEDIDNKLDEVRVKRLELKRKNEELRKEKRRRSREQLNLDLETLGLWKIYESVWGELDATLWLNQTLRRAVKRSEVRKTESVLPSMISINWRE